MLHSIRRNGLVGIMITYVGACLVLGGASRDLLHIHAILQATAALGIATLIATWPKETKLNGVVTPVVLLCVLILIGVLQIVPLPVSLWTALPGREPILEGFESLGVDPTALPISLDKEASLRSLGYALTPLFVVLLCVRIGVRQLKRVVPGFLCFVGLVSATIGLSQVYAAEGGGLYLYHNTNVGFPVGAFANVNHFASLLLMIFPFAVLLTREAQTWRADFGGRFALMAIILVVLLFLCIGIIAAGSLAVYLMFFPVLCAAFLGSRHKFRRGKASGLTILVVISAIVIGLIISLSSPILDGLGVTGSSEDPTSRQNMWSYTVKAIDAYWPVGAGMGTYESVISQYEDPDSVTARYIALAHNEYLQIIVELGAAGACVMVMNTFWFAHRVKILLFRSLNGDALAFQWMATIGLFVCVCHSIVDYPARTPAIASVLALYVVIAFVPERSTERSKKQMPGDPKRLIL